MNTAKDDLVLQLRGTADWRARKAKEHPGDERYPRSAAALTRAADDVAAMSDDDARLLRLANILTMEDEDVVASYSVQEHELIADHGFDQPDATTDELLQKLVDASVKAVFGRR